MSVEGMRRDIREAGQFAEGVIRLLEGAAVPDGLRLDIDRATDQARRVLSATRDPYVLGVLGEFSAGKTMFIASLLGLLDELAIGDRPTTGNVTAFWLRQGAAGSPARIVEARVTYLSAAEAAECRKTLGEQLRQAGTASGLTTAEFEAAVREATDPADDGGRLREWYRAHAALCPDDVGRLATQLVAVAAATAGFPHLLGRSDQPVLLSEVGPLLTITDERTTAQGASMDPDRFWIVRHVAFTVEIPPEILDLDQLVGEAAWSGGPATDRLVIYDFPGFLNHVSGERDLRLTETMLPGMDTVVALLKATNADGPASDHLGRLFRGVFAKDRRRGRVLVGVGNLSAVPEIARLEWPDVRQAERDDDVLRHLPTLKELLDTAAKLSPEEEPFLYSGLAALKRLGLAHSLDSRADDAERTAHAAGIVAGNLPQTSRLKPLFLSVAHDGGREVVLSRLRDRLAEYGLARRHERVSQERERLDRTLDDLEIRLEQAAQQAWAPADAEMMRLLDRVEGMLTSLISEAPTVLADTLTEQADDGPAVALEVRDLVIARVFSWPEWWQILSTASGAEVRDGPATTDAFVPRFHGTCDDAYRASHRKILLRWEEAVIDKAKRSLNGAAPPIGDRNLSEQDAKRLRLLTDPAQWRGMLTGVSDELIIPDDKKLVDAAFPLRRPHRFAWAVPKTDRPPADDAAFAHRLHPGHVLRLRYEVIDAATAVVRRRVDELRPLAAQRTRDFLRRLQAMLGRLRDSLTATPSAYGQTQPLVDELRSLRDQSGRDKTARGVWDEIEDL